MMTGFQRFAARTWLGLLVLPILPLAAADNPELLAAFRQTKPAVAEVHVITESPLLVAVSGPQGTRKAPASWAKGELLGVFVSRGGRLVQVSMVPNNDFDAAVWIERQASDSITFAVADPDYGVRSDNLKVFFDPQTYFPKRIVRYAPVRVSRISLTGGVLTLAGSDGKQDFVAHERNGGWKITIAPPGASPPVRPVESNLQVAPMPISTLGEFEAARPEKARHANGIHEIGEKIGPYQRVGKQLWIGKTFYDAEGTVGVGDIGYYDEARHDWVFLHLPEMADWSTSALLVEPGEIWVGLLRNGEDAGTSGGLLRYDRTAKRATRIPLPDTIDKIVRIGKRLYCGTSGGFAIVDQDLAHRFEFSPQLDGTYVITPVI